MEPSRIPVTIQTGVIQEERSFEWRISNFPVIYRHASLINSQKFDFYAGESIGMGSKWGALLQASERDGKTWVGVYFRLREKPKLTSEHLYAQYIFSFKDKDGVVKQKFEGKVLDWYDKKTVQDPELGVGFSKVFMQDEIPSFAELVDGCLVVHVTFNLFAAAAAQEAVRPLKVKLEEFELKSMAKARGDLAAIMLTENRVPTKDIKIFAKDKKEFKMQKDILSARSPVFQAMLEADMTEGNAGVVELQDMGSKSLKVMLHYMNRGELLPEWSSSEVILELTNAAAKYELSDLLTFLDGVLGDVCNLQNVGMLISLTKQLSLKTGEHDLMCFMRRKGASSSDNFLQILNSVLASESRSGGASAASAGPSPDQIVGHQPSRSCSCSCASCRHCQGKRSGDEMEEDNETEKSKGKSPKKTRMGRSPK